MVWIIGRNIIHGRITKMIKETYFLCHIISIILFITITNHTQIYRLHTNLIILIYIFITEHLL